MTDTAATGTVPPAQPETPRRAVRPHEAPFARLRRAMAISVFDTALYRAMLAAKAPAALAHDLAVRWPGDAGRGAAMLAGDFRFAGQKLRAPAPLWHPPAATEAWLAELHGFDWLADLAAAGGDGARATARLLLRRWIDENAAWHELTWRADVLATRIVAWIAHLDEICAEDEPLRKLVLASLARQARHLARVADWEVAGAARLRALKGRIFAVLVLERGEGRLGRALAALERELPAQIHADGGHVARSPSAQLRVLRDLVDMRTALHAAQLPLPAGLRSAIDRMAPLLRFFRHGDGRLAQFNGASEEQPLPVDLVLARAEAKGRPPAGAPHTGFQRLQAGKTLILVDAGAPPPRGLDDEAHAGTLSFEMSHGRERLIVNCGSYSGTSTAWDRAARATAAHSTLVVDDRNSAELRADGTLGRRPETVAVTREDDDGSVWITASHDGYRAAYGLVHTRRLFLSADGEDLRGEDRLEGGVGGATFAIRFHLHPAVTVSLAQDGAAALLRLPGGGFWRMRAHGAQLALAESVYLSAGEIRKTQQLVLGGPVARGGAVVQWAIRREAKRAAEPS